MLFTGPMRLGGVVPVRLRHVSGQGRDCGLVLGGARPYRPAGETVCLPLPSACAAGQCLAAITFAGSARGAFAAFHAAAAARCAAALEPTLARSSWTAAWQISSPTRNFGSYSALLLRKNGWFLALSDAGGLLRFRRAFTRPEPGSRLATCRSPAIPTKATATSNRPRGIPHGTIWLGLEGLNAILPFARRWHDCPARTARCDGRLGL